MRMGRCRGLPRYPRRLPAHLPSVVPLEERPQQSEAKRHVSLKKRGFVPVSRLDAG